MAGSRISRLSAALTLAFCLAGTRPVRAQGIEVTPFGGYRFGGDFFELVTRQPVDLDGAPALGLVVNYPLSDGFQIEGVYSHEHALVPSLPLPAAPLWRVSVDHYLGGALQEFPTSRSVRPFLTGTLGLTHYGGETTSELRFTTAAGGGVKLFPSRHVGLRLESRVFATWVDAEGTLIACGPSQGVCLFALNVNLVWQAEFTAGLILKWP